MENLLIKIKGIEVEMSKEQAIRTGILKHLFDDRTVFEDLPGEPMLSFKSQVKEIMESDITGIKIKLNDLVITTTINPFTDNNPKKQGK